MSLKNKVIDEKRIYWLDVARFIAIISISMNHAVQRGFIKSTGVEYSFASLPLLVTVLKSVLVVFSRIGVPLFLMISGVLLLGRDYSSPERLKRFYKHNWLPLFITAEIWYAIMFIFEQVRPGSILRTQGILKSFIGLIKNALFIDQVTFGSMWYMAMILLVYLIIPILSIAVQRLDKTAIIIPCIFVVVTGMIVPNINEFLLVTSIRSEEFVFELSVSNLFSYFMVYILAGYYLNKGVLLRLSNKLLALLTSAGFVAVCTYQMLFMKYDYNKEIRYDFFGLLIVSILIFECIKRIFLSKKSKYSIIRISQISFAIYFVHICIMSALQSFMAKINLNPILCTFALEIISVGASIIIIEILSKIKIFKKYLFLIKD